MNQEKLMQLIQKASFAVYDTKLFLDTHPNCQEALDYYHEMKNHDRTAEQRQGSEEARTAVTAATHAVGVIIKGFHI